MNCRQWLVAIPAVLIVSGCGSKEDVGSFVNVWDVQRSEWSTAEEQGFADFVAKVGKARANRACDRLADCLSNRASNPLWSSEDSGMGVFADCADLPYVLRAYYSYKRKLPFELRKTNGSQYSNGNTLGDGINQTSISTLSRLFSTISESVHTGSYRMRPDFEGTDTFPTAVNNRSIRPGTAYYDPNGHVLLVYAVDSNGTVRFIDGHPDNSLSVKVFGPELTRGSNTDGGGFRNFRRYSQRADGRIVRVPNASHDSFSATEQYQRTFAFDGQTVSYHAYVKAKLSSTGATFNAVDEFRGKVGALCEDVQSRIKAVQDAVDAGTSTSAHPGRIPANIYMAENPWEAYSSPGRDSRLRVSLQSLRAYVQQTYDMKKAGNPNLIADGSVLDMLNSYEAILTEMRGSEQCQFTYRKSNGRTKTLSLDDIIARAFRISFDPYHCPEMRWGASGDEAASCPADLVKSNFYSWEKNIRNSIERISTPNPTSGEALLSAGSRSATDVDAVALLKSLISTEGDDPNPHGVVPGTIACPQGYQIESIGTDGGQLCSDGVNAVGPFTQGMIEKCIAWGGGETACRGDRWALQLMKSARGTGVCPMGASLDAVTTYCVEGQDAFGPFPPALVEKCLTQGGGDACRSARWSREFLRGLQGR